MKHGPAAGRPGVYKESAESSARGWPITSVRTHYEVASRGCPGRLRQDCTTKRQVRRSNSCPDAERPGRGRDDVGEEIEVYMRDVVRGAVARIASPEIRRVSDHEGRHSAHPEGGRIAMNKILQEGHPRRCSHQRDSRSRTPGARAAEPDESHELGGEYTSGEGARHEIALYIEFAFRSCETKADTASRSGAIRNEVLPRSKANPEDRPASNIPDFCRKGMVGQDAVGNKRREHTTPKVRAASRHHIPFCVKNFRNLGSSRK
jgi:hypothetical protein